MAHEIKIQSQGESWERLEIKETWETWEIKQHSDGDVEICCEHEEGSQYLFLTQEELKQVIKFLQTKVK